MSGELEATLLVLAARRDEFVEFARRRARSTEDAEDVLQHAFVVAAQNVQALRDSKAVVPWFYRILRNALSDYHATLTLKEAGHNLRSDDTLNVPPPHEGSTCACSLSLLDSLNGSYAEILRRVDVSEQPVEEVARMLGVSVNNATVRLHRARKALRRRLAEFCGTTSARQCLNCRCATAPDPKHC